MQDFAERKREREKEREGERESTNNAKIDSYNIVRFFIFISNGYSLSHCAIAFDIGLSGN